MKRFLIYSGIVTLLAVGLPGCYKDVINPEGAIGPPQYVSFKNDLAPLFNSNCAKAGCHVAGSHDPNLATDESYNSLVGGNYVNTIVPKASILYQKVYGEMSEYIPSNNDKKMVYDWIRNGAPNN